MEHPNTSNPKPVVVSVDASGVTLKREIASAVSIITSTKSPRVG